MKTFFTISEFAKLRDININSLRYYEKLGLLKPAFVDENNGYRYYSVEQVPVLNKIILCIQLGIPLKEMVGFLDEEGNLETQKLLERGRIAAQERLMEMQNNLNYINFSLKNIEENKEFQDRKGVYERYCDERKVLTSETYTDIDISNPKDFLSEIAEIYKYAQKKGMFPILPAGQIVQIGKDNRIQLRFFLEILNCEGNEEKIVTIPKGVYSCAQLELDPTIDLIDVINRHWQDGEKTIIVNNVMLEKYSFKTRSSEIQRLENKLAL